MKTRAYQSEKRKLWEFITFKTEDSEGQKMISKYEEIFDLEIKISKLKQALQLIMTINEKKKLIKKLKSAERKLELMKGEN